MKIAIIGGGASGALASIFIKLKNPNHEVHLYDGNEKLLKKIYATGNGKCNFANIGELKGKYNNENFVLPILEEFDAHCIISFFEQLGIAHKEVNNLIYPYSECAETVASKLVLKINELGINVHLNERLIDYQNNGSIKIETTNNKETYDKIIIATGGCASKKFGNDASIYTILKSHGYSIIPTHPSLCPIRVNEDTKKLDGVRVKCLIKLVNNNKVIYEENGELLFKKDGLSGIAIFNASHFINQSKYEIHVDFVPDNNKSIAPNEYINYLNPKLAGYLYGKHLNIHDTVFTFKDFYDYEFAQTCSGGINVNCVSNNLESNNEKNVFFIGEVLDVDAICGGFNLMWAFASAYKVSNNF